MILRNPAVLWRSTSRGPVVLAPLDDAAKALGGVGAVVWELLDAPIDLDSLRAAIVGFGLDPTSVDTALDELRALGLLDPA